MAVVAPLPSFRMADNLYFVGNQKYSSHLIDTGAGLLLIDIGFEEHADWVARSVRQLGFQLSHIKWIFLSHGHGDHSWGVPRMKEIVAEEGGSVRVYMHRDDLRYIRDFTPDEYFTDGEEITLGNVTFTILHTPGHTAGTVSFFFPVTVDGETHRAGMFGGAGTKQLGKQYLLNRGLPTLERGRFFKSMERLRSVPVDFMIGNHPYHVNTKEGREALLAGEKNPFVNETRWGNFLDTTEKEMWQVMEKESREQFLTYAHRGASEYAPQNTMLSFYLGLSMKAPAIETDIRRTKDGVLVLFHDNDCEKILGVTGTVADYTYEELQQFTVKKGDLCDRVPTFEAFLSAFAWRDITLALELKAADIEADVYDLICKYNAQNKVVVTSFGYGNLTKMHAIAPLLRLGYLTSTVTDELLDRMTADGIAEICPKASLVNAEDVRKWHSMGFNVRAWGLKNEDEMRNVYDCGADGTTCNYPDKLLAYIAEKTQTEM